MAQRMCVQRTQQPLIVLHLQPAINTYMDLFTVSSKLKADSETPKHSSLSGILNEWEYGSPVRWRMQKEYIS